jgi:hypothetical protein
MSVHAVIAHLENAVDETLYQWVLGVFSSREVASDFSVWAEEEIRRALEDRTVDQNCELSEASIELGLWQRTTGMVKFHLDVEVVEMDLDKPFYLEAAAEQAAKMKESRAKTAAMSTE